MSYEKLLAKRNDFTNDLITLATRYGGQADAINRATVRGNRNLSNARHYRDERVDVFYDPKTRSMFVEDLQSGVPLIDIHAGDTIRFHGDFVNTANYVHDLLINLDGVED
jgi:hypothetical protein